MRGRGDGETGIVIECGSCSMRGSDHCGGCVVSFIVNREPDDAVIVDVDEARALRRLAAVGLLPGDRYAPDAGASGG